MIKPIRDKIVVQVIEVETKSAGGLILSSAENSLPTRAVVMAVGEGAMLQDGTIIEPRVKVGDEVVFQTTPDCIRETVDGMSVLVMSEMNVVAIV